MSAPTSWTDLDWDKAHPLDYRYMQSLWAAVAERRHVVCRPDAYKLYPNGYRYTPYIYRGPGQPPSREEFVALRDAIYHLCDGLVGNRESRFIKLDHDYSAGLDEAPVCWTRETLVATEERNIAWMPDAPIYAPAWGDWMRRAKACLDVLVVTHFAGGAGSGLFASHRVEGNAEWYVHDTVAEAIADALESAAATELADPQGPMREVGLSLEVKRYREWNDELTPPAWVDHYSLAYVNQYLGWRFVNAGQLSMIPRVIATRGHIDGYYTILYGDYQYFDGFGKFALGDDNSGVFGIDVLDPGDTRVVDASVDVLSPDVDPDPPLSNPDTAPSSMLHSMRTAACSLYCCLDYRCAGGFQFYTPEEI